MTDKIKVLQDNKEIEYDVLFTTHDEKNNNDYIVYTDNKLNEEGDANIYLGRYKDKQILPITNEEKAKLEKIVSVVQKEICDEN